MVPNATLIYFGINRFVWAKINIQEVGSSYNLSPTHPLRRAIDQDITSLRKSNFKGAKWSVSGHFVKVEDSTIWVYQHQSHVAASDVPFKGIKACVNVTYEPPLVQTCKGKEHHILEPFFATIKPEVCLGKLSCPADGA